MSLLGAGLVALAACHKERNMTPASQQPATETSKGMPGAVKKEKNPPKMYHAQYNPKTGNCWWRFGNCIYIETIIVKPRISELVFSTSLKGSGPAVAELFGQTEFDDMMTYCLTEPGYADKLRSGAYYITRTSDDGKEACYIAGTSYPVTAENMEFAFQFAYGDMEE